jgi:hypothetical protein
MFAFERPDTVGRDELRDFAIWLALSDRGGMGH